MTDAASDASEDSFVDAAPDSGLESFEDDDSWLVLKQHQLRDDVATQRDATTLSNAAIPVATAVQPSMPLISPVPSASSILALFPSSTTAPPKSYASVCADDWVSGPLAKPAEPTLLAERKDQSERKDVAFSTSRVSMITSKLEQRFASTNSAALNPDSKRPVVVAAAAADVDTCTPLPPLPRRPRPRRSRRQQKDAVAAARGDFSERFSSMPTSMQCGTAGGTSTPARPYAAEVQQLALMGFKLSEHPFIPDLLSATQGDVQKALDLLLHS